MAYGRARALIQGLTDEQLAEGILGAELNLAVAVSDHVLAAGCADGTGAAAAAVALAHSALARRTVADPDSVIRALLRRAIPEVDRILFRRDTSHHVWPIRRAILRDRRGPDGQPIVDAEIVQSLLDELEDRRPVALEAAEIAALAVDPRVCRAALDYAIRHARQPMALYALAALCEAGLREEVWPRVRSAVAKLAEDEAGRRRSEKYWPWVVRIGEGAPFQRGELRGMSDHPAGSYRLWDDEGGTRYRRLTPDWDGMLARARSVEGRSRTWRESEHGDPGLDEAAAREDMPTEVRAEFDVCYPRALWLRPRPDAATLRRALADAKRLPAIDRHGALTELVRAGLVSGTVSAAEAVATLPAAEALALLVPGNTAKHNCFRHLRDRRPQAAQEWIADVTRAEAAATLAALGDEPAAWRALWTRVGDWPGTLSELAAEVSAAAAETPATAHPLPAPRRSENDSRTVDPVIVVVSLAPPRALAAWLADVPHDRGAAGAAVRILDRRPLSPSLAEFALGPHGTPDMRRSLARNAAADEAILWRLAAREPAETRILAEVYRHPAATDDLRLAAVLRSRANGGLHPVLAGHLEQTAPGFRALTKALTTGDPLTIHAAAHATLGTVDSAHLAIAYAALAEAGALESVWALELERAGTLEKARDPVRASIASGDAAPLLAVIANAERRSGSAGR